VKRALLLASILGLGLAGCAKQDAALLVTFKGGYRIPQDADTLTVQVRDGTNVIKKMDYGLADQQTPLNATLTLVQSGASHPTVRIEATLTLHGTTMGVGSTDASFADGRTVDVTVTLVPPQ
jgi:hypothetical protein